MREINKNLDIAKLQKTDIKFGKGEKAETTLPTEAEDVVVKDFSNPTAEALGRSQVSKTDNLTSDVSYGLANPQVIESSDKLFEMAYNTLQAQGDENAYEKACAIATSEDAKALLAK